MSTQRALLLVIVAIAVLMIYRWSERPAVDPVAEDPRITSVQAAYTAQRSGVVVEVQGRVDRLLSDDDRGSRHQRFILKLSDGHSLLISHNIDLAPRAPLSIGDMVKLRGQFEWNNKGGVVHWTHHDPQGQRRGGWLEVGGKRYR
jgi:hypothetical protein